jgi:hypothetical protein
MAGFNPEKSECSEFEDETDRTHLDDKADEINASPEPYKNQDEEEKQQPNINLISTQQPGEESKQVSAIKPAETKHDKEKKDFRRRKFDRFMDPPRWVMAERCFETQRRLRCKKLWWEDYSSSSDNDDFWGREVDNVLSD